MTDAAPAQTPAPSERAQRPWRRAAVAVVVAGAAFGLFYYVVPRAIGLESTLKQLRAGDIWWLLSRLPLGSRVDLRAGRSAARGVLHTRASNLPTKQRRDHARGRSRHEAGGGRGRGRYCRQRVGTPRLGAAGRRGRRWNGCYEIITYGVYLAALVISGLGLCSCSRPCSSRNRPGSGGCSSGRTNSKGGGHAGGVVPRRGRGPCMPA